MTKILKPIEWRAVALDDLLKIAEYIAEDNFFIAQVFSKKLKEKVSVLAYHPELGRVGLIKNTREWVAHQNYLIIYRVNDTNIEILRVKHVAQEHKLL